MRTVAVFVLLTVGLSVCDAQWRQTGPYGGTVNCFAAMGTNLFAGTGLYEYGSVGGGVFLSTDNGTSWTSAGLSNRTVNALAIYGTTIFAGTYPNGYGDTTVFRSTDNGTNWTAISLPAPGPPFVHALAVSGANIFAGTNYGVFLTTDNGTNWVAVNSGLPEYPDVGALAVSGTHLFAGAYGGRRGVFLSTNNGTSWDQAGLDSLAVAAFAVSDNNLFAGTGGGVFRSTNSGASWTHAGLDSTSIVAFAVSGSRLFAATGFHTSRGGWVGNGVFLSTDNGSTWNAVNNGLTNKVVISLAVNGSNLLAGTVETGTFLSTDNGTHWTNVNGRFSGVWIRALAQVGTHFFAGTIRFLNLDRVFVSTDNGTHWKESGLARLGEISGFAALGIKLFALSMESGVYVSSDNGFTWIHSLATSRTLSLTASGTDVFVGGDYGVWRSSDGGLSWNLMSAGLPERCAVYALFASGGNLVAGVTAWPGGGVYVSTNNGTSWSVTNVADIQIFCFAGDGTNLFAGGENTPPNVPHAYRSTNNGLSWTQIGLTNTSVHAFALSGTNLFAGTSDGVFLSNNYGESWQDVSTGLENLDISALEVSAANLFAGGTYSGMRCRPLSEMITSVDPPANELPTEFSLHQNYPNPFNPSTTIQYVLPHRSHVTLTVFTTLGQKVATLVNGDIDAGYHSVQFNASNLASGVYFCRIQAGDFVQTRSLLLMK